ncbi:MAG: acyl carrier protein [Flavobacteriales bacterium]|jgi:acyl carrier protein|nr:acyl carrier protein [Flavobacteriales bacterium]
MNEQEIIEEVRRIILGVAPDVAPEAILPTEDVRKAWGIDSFDHLRIIIGLSERFGLEVPEADHGRLRTLKDMVDYVTARRAGPVS